MPTQHQYPGIESRLDSHHPAMEHPPPATGALNRPSHDEGADSVTPKPTDHSILPSDSAVAEKPSDPDSQTSLASSSVVQKPFPRLQVASSDISQSTYGEVLERDMTPPSSSSAFSSQEQPSQPLKYASLEPYRPAVDETMSDDVETRSEATPVENDVPMDRRESVQSSRSGSSVELAPGQKRTASGAVKGDNAPKAQSPGKSREAAHERTMSSDSNGSKMAELSSQLRTRLSYAMVKVQHGWQAHSLGEVETLASQHVSSPTTTSTTFSGRRPPFTSPRTEIAASLRRQWSGSSDETAAHRDFAKHPHPPKHLNGIVQPGPRPVTSPYTSAMRAQESYLRKSSPNTTPRSSQAYHASQKPYLAPPVDIVSGSRRRPAQIATNIPTSNPQSYPTVIPATPPLNPQAALSARQRTPSQNRAMEQDAIETLLFMSSPGNSGHRPNMTEISSTLTSPMQSQFSMTERRVGFADGAMDSSSEEGRKKRPSMASGLSRQVDDLDTILDEMEDDGSSDEDEQGVLVRRQLPVVPT